MKVLGIRNYYDGVRFCILEGEASNISCLNLNKENRILFPKGIHENDLLIWYKDEIDRLFDIYGIFDRVAIKHNENTRSDSYSSLRKILFLDCIVTLEAVERKIPINSYAYNQIGVNSKNVLEKAESLVGKAQKYWDIRMADAIIVGFKEFEDGI
jgi:hypothetical protein